MKKKLQPDKIKLIVPFIIFISLLPLSFTISQNEMKLLLETDFKYVVWFGQAIVLLLLFISKYNMSKKQQIGLSILYILIPFTVTFSENGVSFLILNKYTSSMLSWAIASVLMSNLLSYSISHKNS